MAVVSRIFGQRRQCNCFSCQLGKTGSFQPVEILPVKAVLSSLLSQFVALALLLSYSSLTITRALTFNALDLCTAPDCGYHAIIVNDGHCIYFRINWRIFIYFRDLKDIVQIFSVAGPFLIPAFYLPTQIPELFRPILFCNPFTYMVWVYQDVIYFGRIEHPWAWVVFCTISLTSFVLGYRLFRKVKTMFGNFL